MRAPWPEGLFFFGAATSAHQVEGGNRNDWTEWEKANASRLAEQARRKQWPDYILKNYPSPLDPANYLSGRACDHYHRYEEDFDIAQRLGHNAHRFSIEWSRIEPEEGKFDERELEHYRAVVRALRARGMEPFVTLWHWTIPLWLRDKGGVACRKFSGYFAEYAEHVAHALPEVKFWITLNETNVYTGNGYWRGIWPPGRQSLAKYLSANRRLSQAHIAAYRTLKSANANAAIGVAHNFVWFTKAFSAAKRFAYHHRFLRSIRNYQDFVGINYYFSDRAADRRSEFFDWPIDPDGLHAVIKEAARYRKPIYITENGIADARDGQRIQFIRDHLRAISRAMTEGCDVRGYFYWSLLDNFEWDKGFWPRFGLVEVDYRTLERKIRPSAWVYKEIIEKGLSEIS